MSGLAKRLLPWFERYGRHDLPWQHDRRPYTTWVSEVMLQQTQVATVIPYFERFVRRFPDVRALADANLDHVLELWAGLGYYARARNLHRAARIVVDEHGGELPESFDELLALPGLGRSTAGAILALSRGQRHPILDGNARRVLVRYHGIEGWPGAPEIERVLWDLAARHTPGASVAEYTQAIMDLGATLCTRARPRCPACPLREECAAYASGRAQALPTPRPQRARPKRRVAALIVRDAERRVLLERRPPSGIWGGLFSLPELELEESAAEWCRRSLGARVLDERALAALPHAFTHFDLILEPTLVHIDRPRTLMDRDDWLWYNPAEPAAIGVAAPIRTLLQAAGAEP